MDNITASISPPSPPPVSSAAAGEKWPAVFQGPFFVLFLLPLLLYVLSLPVLPLMEPDETRYALIPQYMNITGDYVTPHLKEVAYLEKPPLVYWATAMFFRICGENAFAARLATGLSAWGCLLLVYSLGCFFHDRKTGLYGAAVLSVSLLPFALGRINILDMPLTFFVCLAIWCGFRFFVSPGGAGRNRWRYGFYGACALAFLTKGMIGVLFPPAVLLLHLLWMRRGWVILRLFSPGGLILFAAPVGAWILLVQRANPDFLWFFFIHEHFLRYTTEIHERVEPFWYYLPVAFFGTTPWWAFLAPALAALRRQAREIYAPEEIRLFTVWTGFVLLFLSLSSSKLASYIAPAALPLAAVMGHLFRVYEERIGAAGGGGPVWPLLPPLLQALALAGLTAVPLFVEEYRRLGPPGGCPLWLVLPVLPAAALAVVPELLRRQGRNGWFAAIYLLFALYLATLLMPLSHYLTPGKSALDVVRAVRAHVPATAVLYQYRMTMYGIDFYTGRKTPIVEDLGELRFGAERLAPAERARRFPTDADFARAVTSRWSGADAVSPPAASTGEQGGRGAAGKPAAAEGGATAATGEASFAVTEGRGNVATLQRSFPAARVVWDNGKFYLLSLPR
jgi:4-amino-4-deoxy-L-arabinose transferase-like glycosyltransferase